MVKRRVAMRASLLGSPLFWLFFFFSPSPRMRHFWPLGHTFGLYTTPPALHSLPEDINQSLHASFLLTLFPTTNKHLSTFYCCHCTQQNLQVFSLHPQALYPPNMGKAPSSILAVYESANHRVHPGTFLVVKLADSFRPPQDCLPQDYGYGSALNNYSCECREPSNAGRSCIDR